MYNSQHLRQMKQEFKDMVEDKFDRRMNYRYVFNTPFRFILLASLFPNVACIGILFPKNISFFSDPAVERDFGRKLYPWRNIKASEPEPASSRLAQAHADRARREVTPVNRPRIFVYHRSTQDLPPPSHIYIR